MRRLGFFIAFCLFVQSAPAFALYSDEIGLPLNEVKPAVEDVLKKSGGIRHSKDNMIESRWSVDRAVRTRGFLKNILSENVQRRSRFKISMKQIGIATEIKIQGVFMERELNGPPSIPWKKVKPGLDDLALERQLFMRILSRLSEIKSKT